MKVERLTKVLQDTQPNKFEIKKLGKKLYELTLNENVAEVLVENEEGVKKTQYQCDKYIGVGEFENKNQIKGAFVRLKYSIDEEFSFVYKDVENEDYTNYRNYVIEAKAFIDEEVLE